jgi:hypothetical protein
MDFRSTDNTRLSTSVELAIVPQDQKGLHADHAEI